MKRAALAVSLLGAFSASIAMAEKALTDSTPSQDIDVFRHYFTQKHSGISLQNFADGVYAIDPISRDSWKTIEEFPPYKPAVENGEEMWNRPFVNGKTYHECFSQQPVPGTQFPRWDPVQKMVVTLPLAINQCREANGEKPFGYERGDLTSLLAYISFQSRGEKTNVVVSEKDSDALHAYNDGKRFFFTRRGQLNFSCASCHVESSGQHVRNEVLSPAIGQTTGWPVYRAKWGELGTLHRRFSGCIKQVRAKPFEAQSEEYRNLEFFLTHMSNGIELNGPSTRK